MALFKYTTLIFVFVFLDNANGQGDPDCFEKGECTDSLISDLLHDIQDVNACLENCQSSSDCEYFTYFEDDNSCMNFVNCINFSTLTCTDCYSGDRDCEELQCWVQGQCNGVLIGVLDDVSENECLDECRTTENCSWLTYDSDGGLCELMEDCQSLDTTCYTCQSSQVQCSEYEPYEPESGYTKLIVIGGSNYASGGYLSSVEVIDLEDPSSTCSPISDYPLPDTGMVVGIIDGKIKSCGSFTDTDACYDYDPETDSWESSSTMTIERHDPRASFIDNKWFVTGDDYNSDDFPYTSDVWTGSGFERGFDLPAEFFSHCQLTVNSTHVFLGDSLATGLSYLLDWYEQTWTILEQMPINMGYASCGLINNPENGKEVVIVEDGESQIFNFNTMTWKIGPSLPAFGHAGNAQALGTFVVVGGENQDSAELATIFQFDHLNYEWIQMSQRLRVAREAYPGVVAVPDEFVTCSSNQK